MLVYTKQSWGKPRLDAKQKRKLEEHRAWVKAQLPAEKTARTDTFDEPGYVRKPANLPPASNRIPGGIAALKSVDDHRWKKGREESPETVREIEAKKAQVAPAYNKGAYQFVTPEADKWSLGRKI